MAVAVLLTTAAESDVCRVKGLTALAVAHRKHGKRRVAARQQSQQRRAGRLTEIARKHDHATSRRARDELPRLTGLDEAGPLRQDAAKLGEHPRPYGRVGAGHQDMIAAFSPTEIGCWATSRLAGDEVLGAGLVFDQVQMWLGGQ